MVLVLPLVDKCTVSRVADKTSIVVVDHRTWSFVTCKRRTLEQFAVGAGGGGGCWRWSRMTVQHFPLVVSGYCWVWIQRLRTTGSGHET
jgi:hypothetical protein